MSDKPTLPPLSPDLPGAWTGGPPDADALFAMAEAALETMPAVFLAHIQGVVIAIEDDGTVYVGADSGEAAEAAVAQINAIANPHLPEKGERYLGTVVKLMPFGAFVSLMPGKDGLLHISKLRALAGGKRVEDPEDVLSVGQKLQVEISEIDDRGKLSLIPVIEETEAAAE